MSTQTCIVTGKQFQVTEAELRQIELLNAANFHFGTPIPKPNIHPLEELRRKFVFTNYMHLFHERSALSGKPQLSRYSRQLGNKICTIDEFWSEAVDNTQFGKDYDFNQPFFPQWQKIFRQSYLLPLNISIAEGSDYVNGANRVKNCYLCFHVLDSQDCLYCLAIYLCNDLVSCVSCRQSQFCYRCVDCEQCYECQECQDAKSSSFCFACQDIVGCEKCIGCIGLRNARYHIFNQPATREDYEKLLVSLNLGESDARERFLEKFAAFAKEQAHKPNRMLGSEDSSGNYVIYSKRAHDCYFIDDCEDTGYLVWSGRSKNCWRGFALGSELSYISMSVNSYNEYCCYSDFDCRDMAYCFNCFQHCSHCFGCVALKSKSYCILNKQYSKAEYMELLPRVIRHLKDTGEWGVFFPPQYSPYNYKQTVVDCFFHPIPDEVAKARSYRFDPIEEETNDAVPAEPASKIPGNFADLAHEQLLLRTFSCEKTGRPFRFQKKELDFYLRMSVPAPKNFWRSRIEELLLKRELVPAV